MKIPLNWLKEYIKTNKSKSEIAKSFTALGLMLDKGTEGELLDLEHRMDRSDWLSIIGCARDLAAFENTELIFPELYTQKGKELPENEKIKIEIKCPNKVNRFNTRVFKNIKVGKSPEWMKERLETYGIPSINNIVDITNYVMVELGQPMHAQDIDKLEAKEIIIRDAKKGEKIITLLGETVELAEENFALTQNDKPTVIGGIVGGKETGVTENTTNIILDAGNYNQVFIRKASRKLKIQNETVSRCDKFLHPQLTEIALQRATKLILDITGGEYYENEDCYPNKPEIKTQTFRMKRLEQLSGMKFDIETIKNILTKLEYKIIEEKNTNETTNYEIKLEIPYFRTDVEVEDDIVADILRISNYENIPLELIQSAPPKEITPDIYKFEDKVRDILVNLGLHEHITDPLIEKGNNDKKYKEIVLENALTSEKSALRTDIKQTLNHVLENYKKHKINEIGIFEIGKIYYIDNNLNKENKYVEERVLEIIYLNQNLTPKGNADKFKTIINRLLEKLKVEWGSMQKTWTITPYTVSIPLEKLMQLSKEDKSKNKQSNIVDKVSSYTTEDLSIVINITQSFGDIYQYIKNINNNVLDVEILEEYKVNETQKSVLVRIVFNTSDTKNVREKILKTLRSEFNVDIRV